MKLVYLIIALLVLLKPVTATMTDNAKFAGDWSYQSQKDEETSLVFELHLKTQGKVISGRYCAISRGGRNRLR